MTILHEVENSLRQEECEDNIYHVICYHCGMEIDPNEEPVYCWNVEPHGAKQIFVCEGCDAEHRTNLKTVLQVKEWRRDYDNG